LDILNILINVKFLDHIITMLQNLSQYDAVLARSHSNYLAQINIELSSLSNGTNKVVNRLTFFATMAIPLNLIAGLFGMNVMVNITMSFLF
jgi:magnesium transporter